MKNYYQPEIETMPLEQLQDLQSERLVKQVKYVYDNVKFYHDKMDEAGVKPEDITGILDLHKLPFVTKTRSFSVRTIPFSTPLSLYSMVFATFFPFLNSKITLVTSVWKRKSTPASSRYFCMGRIRDSY